MQAHPSLAGQIPVVVLTGSIIPEDMKRAKELGAVDYEVKPIGFTDLVEIAKKTLNITQLKHNQGEPSNGAPLS